MEDAMGGIRASVFVLLLALAVPACGGGGGAKSVLPAPVTAASTPNLPAMADLNGVAQSLALQQRADGAILYTADQVNPYFANIAAIGAIHGGLDLPNVQRWMQWYVARSADPNPWSLSGAITDYYVAADGSLRTTGEADSIDSYAATFLSLAATAWREGDPSLRAYVGGLHADVERIASALAAVSDSDGLTWALPTYRVKYLMDNSEVYRGLLDLATLRTQAYGDLSGGMRASAQAQRIQSAIAGSFWDAGRGAFAVEVDDGGAKGWPIAGDWQGATAQLFPILHGVVAPSSVPAQTAYARFSSAFPGWPTLQKPDEYPWVSVAFVAVQMSDLARANTYASAVQQRYVPSFAYPWYCAESGWYVRLLLGLEAPQTVANL
jgi:hypothetical protein